MERKYRYRTMGLTEQAMKDAELLRQCGFVISRLLTQFYMQSAGTVKTDGIVKLVTGFFDNELPIEMDNKTVGQTTFYVGDELQEALDLLAGYGLNIQSIGRRFLRSVAIDIEKSREENGE